jgi:hypothetical protein
MKRLSQTIGRTVGETSVGKAREKGSSVALVLVANCAELVVRREEFRPNGRQTRQTVRRTTVCRLACRRCRRAVRAHRRQQTALVAVGAGGGGRGLGGRREGVGRRPLVVVFVAVVEEMDLCREVFEFEFPVLTNGCPLAVRDVGRRVRRMHVNVGRRALGVGWRRVLQQEVQSGRKGRRVLREIRETLAVLANPLPRRRTRAKRAEVAVNDVFAAMAERRQRLVEESADCLHVLTVGVVIIGDALVDEGDDNRETERHRGRHEVRQKGSRVGVQ